MSRFVLRKLPPVCVHETRPRFRVAALLIERCGTRKRHQGLELFAVLLPLPLHPRKRAQNIHAGLRAR